MLKEQMKRGHAVTAFGIVCICVAVVLLLLSFCVDGVFASVKDYEFDSDGYVEFKKIVSVTDEFDTLADGNKGGNAVTLIFDSIRFSNIGYYDSISWIRVIPDATHGITWGIADSPVGAQTPFIAYIGGDRIGSGEIMYSKNSNYPNGVVLYLFFDSFDRGEYTGTVDVDLTFSHYDLWDIQTGTGVYWSSLPAGDEIFAFNSPDRPTTCFLRGGYGGAGYKIQYGGDWSNSLQTTPLGTAYLTLAVTKDNDLSKWKIWTDSFEYVNELTKTGADFTISVFETPVYINVSDVWDNYHTVTYTELPSENQLYGYVFDAADNFGIEGAFVEFQDANMTTSDTGFYSFVNDTFGEYWLNVSKIGYQNSTNLVDYQGSARLDVYMVANETVNPGTCTVAGVVYDSDLHPINDAYVKIFNDTFSTYIYTSSSGYFVFYDLTNTAYSLSAEHPDYIKQQKSINLTDLDTAYYYTFMLLGEGVTPGITPTPTPTVAPDMIDAIDVWWDILGLLEWKGLIYAMIVIGGLGMALGVVSGGNGWVAAIGAFFGFVLSVAFGWIPIWVVALGLIGAAIIMVKVLGSDNR